LAFAYSPNPTDTWFLLPALGTSPVVNDVLAQWDTTQISDGVYTLRLRMFWEESTFLEAFVQNVRVQNATPTPAPTSTLLPSTDAVSGEAGAATPGPSATPVIVLPATSTPRPTADASDPGGGSPPASDGAPRIYPGLMGTAFLTGVRFSMVSFLILGAYVSFRSLLRSRPRR
jgi:hypothetical protein